MKQVRIYVNGHFQFTVKVPQERSLQAVADSARETMKLAHFKAQISPGIVNLVPR